MADLDALLQGLVERVREARALRRPFEIRGGGSKAFYGNAPKGEPLDLRPFAGIRAYEPSELVVTVRAGTPLAELEAALAAQGQGLAFEPPHFVVPGESPHSALAGTSTSTATVGGMVAAGLAGPARATAGGVRDHLLGLTLLDGRGELLNFGGTVMKNVAGYDVSRVMAGALGTLGVILEVSLKVLPRPPALATLRFELDEAAALRQLHAWGGQPLPLSASAWWDGMLVLRLAGAEAAVQAAARKLGGEPIAPALADGFWRGLRDHQDEFFVAAQKAVAAGATLWRLSLPATAPVLALPGERLIEWGGAQRWVVTTAPAGTLRDAAAAAGGHAVAFRGDKGAGAFAPLAPPLAAIQRRLKQAFDPEGLFNPGRLVADW